MNPVLHILLVISPLMAAGTVVAAWQRREQPGIRALAGIGLATVIWGLTYYLEVLSPTLSGKLFWAVIKYPVIALMPIFSAMFFLRYAGQHDWPGRTLLILLLIIPCLTVLLVFTNGLHHLFWSSTHLALYEGYTTLSVARGPWFYIFVLYSYGLLLASGSAALAHLNRLLIVDRRPIWLITVFLLVPAAFNLAGMMGFTLFPGIDPSPFSFGLSGMIIASFSARKFSLFNPVRMAHSSLLEQMREGVIVLDHELKVLEINLAALRMLHKTRVDIINQPLDALGSQAANLLRGRIFHGTVPVETRIDYASESRWFEVRVTPLLGNRDETVGYMSVWHEVTERKHIEEELRHASTHDQLTGLYNRLFFEEHLDRISRGRHWPVTVLMTDLDHLKQTNDTLGHAVGDELICRAGNLLQSALRQDDVVARIGGDEFAALLTGCDEVKAAQVIQRLHDSLRSQNPAVQPQVRLSMGFAVARFGAELEDALRLADINMYAEKNQNRE